MEEDTSGITEILQAQLEEAQEIIRQYNISKRDVSQSLAWPFTLADRKTVTIAGPALVAGNGRGSGTVRKN